MADDLEAAYESPGFQIFWRQYLREVEAKKVEVMETGKRDPRANPTAVHGELRYRQGVLDGVLALDAYKDELLKILRDGRIPWEKNRIPE